MAKINWYFHFAVIVMASGGIPKGWDEGGFSAAVTLESFEADYYTLASEWKTNPAGLASRTANITSFGVLGAAFGALLAIGLVDRFGRLRSWQIFAVTWACGLFMQVFSTGIYGFLLFARICSGLGAGGLTVAGPLFLSEIAPAKIRGRTVSMYMVFVLSFLSLGFFVNYGVSVDMSSSRTQYRLVEAIPMIPVFLTFVGSFFLMDTPRWLASQNRFDEAAKSLALLRNKDPSQSYSLADEDVLLQVQMADQQLEGTSIWKSIKEVATVSSYRKRFLIGMFLQVVSQMSGGNGITYYVTTIFKYAGVQGANTPLVTSGAYGLVKLVFTMVFTWGLVDYFGRRRSAVTGVTIQCATHVYMACYMALFKDRGIVNQSASDAAIASVFIYAVGWSIGLCVGPYVYGTEIYPTRIRSFCYAANMGVHWFFQFLVVLTTPSMFVGMNIYGAYVFWAVICAIGTIGLSIAMPETKGVSLEQMDELFSTKWYLAWRARKSLSAPPEIDLVEEVKIRNENIKNV